MATYKVLQDIEAEDKLVGPLTLRQCIYAAIAAFSGYLMFLVISKGAAALALVFLPFFGFGVFFAFPWTKQQSTEVWALAKIRFMIKPRKRIWDQSGVKQLVTITAPRRAHQAYQRELSQVEVKSRLKALAETIDSRGWAVKNVDLNYYTRPALTVAPSAAGSDRLVDSSSLPQEVPGYDTTTTSDIFDIDNNPVAQQFDAMMAAAANAHRQQIIQQMTQQQAAGQLPQPEAPAAYWHMAQQPVAASAPAPAAMGVAPAAGDPTPAEEAFAQQLKMHISQPTPEAFSNLRTIQPVSGQPPADTTQVPTAAAQASQLPDGPPLPLPMQPAVTAQMPAQLPTVPTQTTGQPPIGPAQSSVTPPPNPAILELANNNDLNIATIAREAQARSEPPDEVVVSLH